MWHGTVVIINHQIIVFGVDQGPPLDKCMNTDFLTVIVKIWEFTKENKRNIVKRNNMKAKQSWMRQYKNLRSHNISRWFSVFCQHSLRIGFLNADQDIHCPDTSLHIITLARIFKSSWCLVPQPRNHNSCQGRVRVTDTPIRPPIKKLDTSQRCPLSNYLRGGNIIICHIHVWH